MPQPPIGRKYIDKLKEAVNEDIIEFKLKGEMPNYF